MPSPAISATTSSAKIRQVVQCHRANLARWEFNKIGKLEVDRVFKLLESANETLRAHKTRCRESTEIGWECRTVTPWPRSLERYIMVPIELLYDAGCLDEAERTWLKEIGDKWSRTVVTRNRVPHL